jgi:hypothetical protein
MWRLLSAAAAALSAAAVGRCGQPRSPDAPADAPATVAPVAPAPVAPAAAARAEQPAQPARPSAMRPLAESAHLFTSENGAAGEPGLRVVRDRAAWEAEWRALQAGFAAGPAPAVDFARDMVVVVAAGEQSSGGHRVRVDGTSPGPDGALVVHVTRTAPGPGCMSTMAITSPVDVVRVPRAPGAVRADTRTVTEPCG